MLLLDFLVSIIQPYQVFLWGSQGNMAFLLSAQITVQVSLDTEDPDPYSALYAVEV